MKAESEREAAWEIDRDIFLMVAKKIKGKTS